MSCSGSLMTLCWAESLVAQTLALKFKITEASWKRKQMKFSRDNSIKGLQCRRRKNINREVILKQSRMQYLIREVHVKCQGSSVEKNYISPWFKSCYVKSFQLCLTLCNPTDCSSPGSSVHGILHARILERVARPSSRGSSQHPGTEPESHVSPALQVDSSLLSYWRRPLIQVKAAANVVLLEEHIF